MNGMIRGSSQKETVSGMFGQPLGAMSNCDVVRSSKNVPVTFYRNQRI